MWLWIILILNALAGYLLIEFSWKKTATLRDVDEDRDGKYPAFRRYDVGAWKKHHFYLGGLTVMPIRVLISILLMSFIGTVSCLVVLGLNFDGSKPLPSPRRQIYQYLCKLTARLLLYNQGCRSEWHYPSTDYSYYLGPDYKSKIRQNWEEVALLTCNHISYTDILVMGSGPFCPGFVAKQEITKAPVVGSVCKGLNCIYVSRAGTPEERQKNIKQIEDRQTDIDRDQAYSKIIIFPGGTTTNPKYLIPFKKGAFESLKPVVPIVLDYSSEDFISSAYDIIDFVPLICLRYSILTPYTLHVKLLPPVQPTEYMFEKFKDKGKEKWEIFAWVVRDIMAKEGKLKTSEQSLKEKFEYQAELRRIQKEKEKLGKTD